VFGLNIIVVLIYLSLDGDGERGPGQKSTTPVSRMKKFPRDKKAEQVAKEAAEYAKKHGVCSIHVPVGPLFVGR